MPKALLYLSGACSFQSAAFALSQVIWRAVYGVVIVSYIAPYLPEHLHSLSLRCSFHVLCHSSRAGYVTYTITAHHNAALSLLSVSVPSHPHHVSLQAHYIYIMSMHGTSTAVHFTCLWGSHVGAVAGIAIFVPSHYSYARHLHRCP